MRDLSHVVPALRGAGVLLLVPGLRPGVHTSAARPFTGEASPAVRNHRQNKTGDWSTATEQDHQRRSLEVWIPGRRPGTR